ncbi:MAG: hypothetical protein JWO06_717 [Bacteroidota bacterium]|nr:hypothetical protein [Bacteroidota bacterium]
MNQILRFLGRALSVIIVLVLIAVLICFKLPDTKPYQDYRFYKKELAEIDSSKKIKAAEGDTMEVGWCKVNLLPAFTTPIAIDAHRGGKHFEGVHDSIYVRAFVFKLGNKKVAYVSADLLIIPPTVTNLFDSILLKEGFNADNIYFTATHTHTSIGAWHNSYVGKLFAGKFDVRVPQHIAACISKAIIDAEKNCSPATIGYGEFKTSKLVFNRLVREKGKVDSMLRIVKIEKQTGEKAAIITFAAHATVFHENLMSISADWPGQMMTALEKSGKVDFASFSAGAVGSHGPYEFTKDQEAEAKYMSDGVGKAVADNFDSIATYNTNILKMVHLPLLLRQPNMRIAKYVALRPWLFKKLFGDEKVYLNSLQLGNIIFEGTPCDFSGELLGSIDSVARKKNLKLLVTSFNGGYIGYVTDRKWYSMNAYETRTMGWFGPGTGDYISEVMMRLTDGISPFYFPLKKSTGYKIKVDKEY